MNALARWTCWIGATLGGGAALWSWYELLTLENRFAIIYQIAYFLLALLNMVPISGVFVGRALEGLPRERRLATFLAWLIPAVVVLLVDLFVIVVTVGSR
jgi:hypothetical protein